MAFVREMTVSEFFGHWRWEKLVGLYASECALAGIPAPVPDVALYEKMEAVGVFNLLGGFQGEQLVGFVTMVTAPNPHYSQTFSTVESIFVEDEARGSGVGVKLLVEAGRLARTKGASALMLSAPVGSRFANVLLKDRRYRLTNFVFTRPL